MERRAFIVGGMAALAAPLAAKAQQARSTPKLCILAYDSLSSPSWAQRYRAFVEGLHDLGYVDRRNITVHFLSADGDYERFPALAAECVRLEPNVIVAYTTPGSLAAKKATRTIPIVTGPIGDPVGTGVVASLARPGGNVTGQTVMATGLSGKRLELLKEAVPTLSRLLVLSQQPDPISAVQLREIEKAAGSIGLRLLPRGVGRPDDLSAAVAAAVNDGAEALVTTVGTFFIVHRARIAEIAARHRLPAMYPVRDDNLRTRYQRQDRQSARSDDPAVAAGAGGSGDRMIERRGFIVSGVAVLLTPLAAAEAQHAGKVYRIGYLASSGNPRVFDTFREGLRDLGWTEGQNIVIDYRSRRASSTVFPPSQPNWSG